MKDQNNTYYRIFHTSFGNIAKSNQLYLKDDKIKHKGTNHKIKGTIDEAYEVFEKHCIYSKIKYPRSKSQHLLLELGTDSNYNIVAIEKLDGTIYYLK